MTELLQAALQQAKLDLEYTKVIAPVSGRVSRYVVTVGNLIQSGDQNGGTLLTTIVSVDPMYAYFDVDEHTVLRVRKLIRERVYQEVQDFNRQRTRCAASTRPARSSKPKHPPCATTASRCVG